MFAQDKLLATRHEILKEDYESLKQDYASLEERFKHVQEIHEMMKYHFHNQNQTVELEATNIRLLKDLERERSEKDEFKKMVEEMKKIETESKAMIDDLRMTNEEVLIAMEKGEGELKNMENKHDDLAARLREVEKECSYLKSLYDTGQGGKNAVFTNEVVVVDDDDNDIVNNNVIDAIMISDGSDAEEYDNLLRESNLISHSPLDIKQGECNNGANSSQANHPSSNVCDPYSPSSSSSSSSSSSDGYVLLQVPVKRPATG